MLKGDEVRPLTLPSSLRSLAAIVIDWFLIALNFWLAVRFPNPLIWCFCFIFAARQQLALAILMHDGAHRRLFRSSLWNDYICQFTCASPLFFSMYSYQRLHLKHHRDPLAPDDPDLSLIGGYPISLGSFLRKLARDAFGISYYKFIRYFIYVARKPRANPSGAVERDIGPRELTAQGSGTKIPMTMIFLSMIFMNGMLWASLHLIAQGWLFLFFWVLPAVTVLQVLLRIRGIAEHAGYQANPDQRMNARTVINPIQTFLFAPHNVHYHIEHHVYPAVPFYNLPKLHDLMMTRDLIPRQNIYPGYGRILIELIRQE